MSEHTRRALLAGLAGTTAALAGCSSPNASGWPAAPTETPDPVSADVTYGTWEGSALNETTFEPELNEQVFQVSLSLESAADGVTRVDAVLVTDEGSQTATWLLPEQAGETRILGSRNIYDRDDVVNPESGDVVEVRAWRDGTATVTDRFEL